MDMSQRRQLEDEGLVVSDSNGTDAVRVYLEYLSELKGRTRDARRRDLQRRFHGALRTAEGSGLEINATSLSVSGQNVEALVPLAQYDHVQGLLKKNQIRVQPVRTFNATLE